MVEIIDIADVGMDAVLRRREQETPDVSPLVAEILADVRRRGDKAVLEYTARFDGVKLETMLVTPEEMQQAIDAVGAEFMAILQEAAQNIREYHTGQVRGGFIQTNRPGVVMGQRILPLERVGLYVPGGTAAYPSTVLMDAIPAKIAGVSQLVMVTPPGKDGRVNNAILAAASVAGVTHIFKVGGAQAVGALSYGTQTIPRVDKIVGPGNLYVATAKRMVYGLVDIDMIAGPSDILVVADDTARAEVVAADMLGQAEHDVNAASVLVTPSKVLAQAVQAELEKQLPLLSRAEIAGQSLENNGRIILCESVEAAVDIANALAPEHLELCVDEPFALLERVRNAGSIFLGHNTPEALGDYFAGPNHTLPTGGTSRFYSPLSVDDFIKKSSYLYYSAQALEKVGDKVQVFAKAEGLTAHAKSVEVRMK